MLSWYPTFIGRGWHNSRCSGRKNLTVLLCSTGHTKAFIRIQAASLGWRIHLHFRIYNKIWPKSPPEHSLLFPKKKELLNINICCSPKVLYSKFKKCVQEWRLMDIAANAYLQRSWQSGLWLMVQWTPHTGRQTVCLAQQILLWSYWKLMPHTPAPHLHLSFAQYHVRSGICWN